MHWSRRGMIAAVSLWQWLKRCLFWSFKLKVSCNLFIWRLKRSIILVFIFQVSLGVQAIQNLNTLGSITLPSSLLTNLPTEELDLASRIIFNFFKKTTVFQVFFWPTGHKAFKLKLRAKYLFSPQKVLKFWNFWLKK